MIAAFAAACSPVAPGPGVGRWLSRCWLNGPSGAARVKAASAAPWRWRAGTRRTGWPAPRRPGSRPPSRRAAPAHPAAHRLAPRRGHDGHAAHAVPGEDGGLAGRHSVLQHCLQVPGQRLDAAAARRGLLTGAVPAQVVGDDLELAVQCPDDRSPERDRARPAVHQHDRRLGRVRPPVRFHVQPDPVGGGDLAPGGRRGQGQEVPGRAAAHVPAAGITVYSPRSTRRVAWRNCRTEPGHSVGLRPSAVRYQLGTRRWSTRRTHPPVMPAAQRCCASGRASSAAAPGGQRGQVVQDVAELGLDDVDGGVVPEAGVRPDEQAQVGEAGHRGAAQRGIPAPTPRPASPRPPAHRPATGMSVTWNPVAKMITSARGRCRPARSGQAVHRASPTATSSVFGLVSAGRSRWTAAPACSPDVGRGQPGPQLRVRHGRRARRRCAIRWAAGAAPSQRSIPFHPHLGQLVEPSGNLVWHLIP